MWYILAALIIGLIARAIYVRRYHRNHATFVIVDFIDGDFKPRAEQVIRWPPKWFK